MYFSVHAIGSMDTGHQVEMFNTYHGQWVWAPAGWEMRGGLNEGVALAQLWLAPNNTHVLGNHHAYNKHW